MSFHDKLLSRKGRARTVATANVKQQISGYIKRAKTFDIAPSPTVAPPRTGGLAARSELAAPPPSAPPFTVRSLSERWGCSEGVVRSVIERGELGHFRVGYLIRVPAEEVRRFECGR